MKNHLIKVVLLFAIALLLTVSCSKNDVSNQNVSLQDENLLDPVDDELNSILANIPSDTRIQAADLKFEDGTSILDFIQQYDPIFLNEHQVNKITTTQSLTPENQQKLLIGKMILMAQSLVKRNNWTDFNGSNQPNGIAYNWGSKYHKQSKKPANYPKGSSTLNLCQESLYGVDCSGMIYQMALAAGINLVAGGASAEFERTATNWNNKFSQSTNYIDLKAKLYKHTGVSTTDATYIDINGIKEGDLIFKTNKGEAVHIGMVLRSDYVSVPSNLSIFQSNGKPNLGCDVNKSTMCGPRIISLLGSETFGIGKLFGVDWQVLRFETAIASQTCNDTTTPYPTITIGGQVWMQKNLNVCKYRNGDPIIEVQDYAAWTTQTTGAWCYYENKTVNGSVYGKLYNWYAVNDPRGLAPVGWHVPSDAEWTTLITFLGGESMAGSKMKTNTEWVPYTGITNTNSSGFTGLPGGSRASTYGAFGGIGISGNWWCSIQNNNTDAFSRILGNDFGGAYRLFFNKASGFSVRCIKD